MAFLVRGVTMVIGDQIAYRRERLRNDLRVRGADVNGALTLRGDHVEVQRVEVHGLPTGKADRTPIRVTHAVRTYLSSLVESSALPQGALSGTRCSAPQCGLCDLPGYASSCGGSCFEAATSSEEHTSELQSRFD